MNNTFKILLDKAIDNPKNLEKMDTALGEIYTKLIVLPIQKSWRSKSPSEKMKVAGYIQHILYKECIECNMIVKTRGNLTCLDCYLGDKVCGYYSE